MKLKFSINLQALFLLTISTFIGNIISAQNNEIKLLPYPNDITRGKGNFEIIENINVINRSDSNNENRLNEILKKKKNCGKSNKVAKTIIIQEISPKNSDSESYKMSISVDTINIEAHSSIGVFYGIQTLNQLIKNYGNSIPCMIIRDAPAYKWRAFMLDESRYFKGKDVVKRLLDKMSAMKMNTFHWHLTDDQGWRIEIKKYPKLTQIGARRDSSQIGGWKSPKYDGMPHSGYYTQNDIREIVEYAANLHITIVPEIEMPGHATAAIASYPFVGVLDHKISVPCTFGIKSSVFNIADKKTIAFLHDILKEVFELFPGKVIHIGGDEIHVEEWKASKEINDYMKKLQLTNYNDLQLYFTNQISHFIEKNNRRIMGWNDIMGKNIHEWSVETDSKRGELSRNAIIHFWKGDSILLKEALEKGYDIVNSYHYFTYLDYDLDKLPLSKAYGFSPFPLGMDEKHRSQVLGLGCQMWCEWIPTEKKLYEYIFPRIAAYAEVGWTSSHNKDFNRFKKAYAKHFGKINIL